MTIYYRGEWGQKKQTAEIAISQVHTGEIWGQVSRNSGVPAIKAKPGVLPLGTNGVEFETDIPPDDIGPAEVFWYPNVNTAKGLKMSDDEKFAQMSVTFRRVRYTTGDILQNGVDWKP
ncbi:MAG TPA: hypothetical protein PLT54_06770 [Rhodoferax sp.]|jgi:hypothetical protein|nr:hypothetical protein [Rhodoferax sp.]